MAVSGQCDLKPVKAVDKSIDGKNDFKKQEMEAKFQIGEQVLCYEPDPTKAKMLYEAKVLETDVTKDEKGNKVPEFFIHFIGWNKSWDRWVLTDSVLKDCETNRNLQAKLYEKAVGPKKRQKTRKRKQDDDFESIETNSLSNQSTANSSQAEGEESSDLPVVCINIPHVLKCKLEDDCYLIKRRKKLLKLPRVPSALKILSDFLEFCEMQETNECLAEFPYLKNVDLEIVREMVQGLQTYLNFTLSALLLYNFEKEQYARIFPYKQSPDLPNPLKHLDTRPPDTAEKPSAPLSEPNSSPRKKRGRKLKRGFPRGRRGLGAGATTVHHRLSTGAADPRKDKTDPLCAPPRRRGRPSLKRKMEMSAAENQQSHCQQNLSLAGGKDNLKNTSSDFSKKQAGKHLDHRSPASAKIDPTATEDRKEAGIKSEPVEQAPSSNDLSLDKALDSSQTHKTDEKEGADKQIAVDVKKGGDHSENGNPTDQADIATEDSEGNPRSLRPRRPLNSESHPKISMRTAASREQHAMPVGTSASSLISSDTVAAEEPIAVPIQSSQEPLPRDTSKEQDSSYSPFPLSLVESRSPAEIYGAEHLLRLFVKLPSLISRTELDTRKRVMLVEYLEKFLRYMAERANTLFDSNHYSESVI